MKTKTKESFTFGANWLGPMFTVSLNPSPKARFVDKYFRTPDGETCCVSFEESTWLLAQDHPEIAKTIRELEREQLRKFSEDGVGCWLLKVRAPRKAFEKFKEYNKENRR